MTGKRKEKLIDIALILLALGFAIAVNRGISIRGLYMDDLYMWSCYGEQSFLEFVFPIGTSTRFRPVYWMATYLEMALIGIHVERFVWFNILVNVAAAAVICHIIGRITSGKTTGKLVGFISMLLYLASRFSYYQIGQVLGLMETMALILALLVFYELFMYGVKGEGGRNRFFAGLIIYFLLSFTHERYIALFPLFYLALFLRSGKKRGEKISFGELTAPLFMFLVIAAVRLVCIGSIIPAGTGGTYVEDTFNLGQAIGFGISEVLYIFGINCGPEYLSGLSFSDSPAYIRLLVLLGIVWAAFVFLFYIAALVVNSRKYEGSERAFFLRNEFAAVSMFLSFLALSIACSSVTIRLEMRWIYVSYACTLIFASYMTGETAASVPKLKAPALAAFIGYAVLTIYLNIFYRGYFPNIYFWENQLRMNSLYDETIGHYGTEGVFGKKIYIVGNTYGMTDFYAETFFKPFDPDHEARGTEIIFVESAEDIPKEEIMDGEALALMEAPEETGYLDISDIVGK